MFRSFCPPFRSAHKRLYHTKETFGYWKKPYVKRHLIPEEWLTNRTSQPNLWRLVTSYRDNGHLIATTDPLNKSSIDVPSHLSPDYYGLDLSSSHLYNTTGILHSYEGKEGTLEDIMNYLKRIYSSDISIEVQHIEDPLEKEWILQCYESHITTPLSSQLQSTLANKLLRSQIFDQFLAKKFATVKRYGAEGAESMIGFIEECLVKACESDITDILIGMPHRGRLNLLVDTLQYPLTAFFNKIKGQSEFPQNVPATGDVISHISTSTDLHNITSDKSLHVSLLPNPSHLEAINPVIMGKTRARMLSLLNGPYSAINNEQDKSKVLCLQVHGDAAFAAQGVVTECLAISNTPHFEVGGSVHLIVNNFIGFTTPPQYGRSSPHSSDAGKMIGAPIIHVNGNHPEEVIRGCRIAMDYRQEYEKDVIVSLNCYRRWGHNELDDPSMTQPQVYKHIDSLSTVPDTYWKQKSSTLGEDKESVTQQYYDHLNKSLKDTDTFTPTITALQCQWSNMELPSTTHITQWDTGLPADLLKYIGAKSVHIPDTLSVHHRLKRAHIEDRINKIQQDTIDWSTAEAMAIGSLLYQGFNVRLSGQDVGRGTFSHRHVMLVDQESSSAFIPLNSMMGSEQKHFIEVANSPLSEEAVLGYEYGYSIESPNYLVLWEAQFGDFFNGAQIIIDTFISSGEDKWMLQSGLVMLLPHGYDGAGPEHSSCRIERFLQNTTSSEEGPDTDNVNMNIVHPTTPSQYYHLLRRQMLRTFRKPLIVQSPKTLLRLPRAVSSLADMSPGTSFKPVIGDEYVTDTNSIKRVVLCSGKHYYALDEYRKANDINNTALIRLELLCPFPSGALYNELNKYINAKEFIWSQEEPANMGVWSFVEPRIRKQLGINLHRVSRGPYGPPASGIGSVHQLEVKQLLNDTFK